MSDFGGTRRTGAEMSDVQSASTPEQGKSREEAVRFLSRYPDLLTLFGSPETDAYLPTAAGRFE